MLAGWEIKNAEGAENARQIAGQADVAENDRLLNSDRSEMFIEQLAYKNIRNSVRSGMCKKL